MNTGIDKNNYCRQSNFGIFLIPAIRTLMIRNIGIWKNAEFRFSRGLNIIAGYGGTGKTIIIKSLIYCFTNEIYSGYLRGKTNSGVEIEMYSRKYKYICLPEYMKKQVEFDIVSGSKKVYRLLRDTLLNSKLDKNTSVLIDDFTSFMDSGNLNKTICLIKKAKCQIIMVVRDKNKLKQFDNARLFRCAYNKNFGKAYIEKR